MWPSTRTFDWYLEGRRSLKSGLRRLKDLVLANRKVAGGLVVGLIVVLGLMVAYSAWMDRQEATASALLFRGVKQLSSDTRTDEGRAQHNEGVRVLQEVATRYPRTAAAAEATLRLGGLHYSLGNYDEARNVYQKYLEKNPKGRIAFSAGLGVADTYVAQSNYDKAVETYTALISQFSNEPLLPQAYLHLARTYLSMKRTQDASRIYRKVSETYRNTGWAQYAQTQLRRLRAPESPSIPANPPQGPN